MGLTPGSFDIAPRKPCMYERSSYPFGRTVCTRHEIWANHTAIRYEVPNSPGIPLFSLTPLTLTALIA